MDVTNTIPVLAEKLYYNSTGLCKSYAVDGTVETENTRSGYNIGRSHYIPFGWCGMYRDPFTGKYHTHFRDYDPVHGRWLSEDPAGYADGLNLYNAYMGVNGVDPLGLYEGECLGDSYFEEICGKWFGPLMESICGGHTYYEEDSVDYGDGIKVVYGTNYVHYSPKDGVGGVLGAPLRELSLRFIPIESHPSVYSLNGLEAGTALVPYASDVCILATGQTTTGQPISRLWAAAGLAIDGVCTYQAVKQYRLGNTLRGPILSSAEVETINLSTLRRNLPVGVKDIPIDLLEQQIKNIDKLKTQSIFISQEFGCSENAVYFNSVVPKNITLATDGIDSCYYQLAYKPTSGVQIVGDANKTTTLLGNYKLDMKHILNEMGNIKTLDFGPKPGSFNVLNVPDELYLNPSQFWSEYNQPWLDKAILRGDNFIFVTEPTWDVLIRENRNTGKIGLSGFGKEYFYLRKKGIR